MKSTRFALFSFLFAAAPLAAHAGEQLIPAGSLPVATARACRTAATEHKPTSGGERQATWPSGRSKTASRSQTLRACGSNGRQMHLTGMPIPLATAANKADTSPCRVKSTRLKSGP